MSTVKQSQAYYKFYFNQSRYTSLTSGKLEKFAKLCKHIAHVRRPRCDYQQNTLMIASHRD